MENLGRGVIAVRSGDAQAYVGWRMLGTDAPSIGFNLYRSTGGEEAIKLNGAPITCTTDFVDSTADLSRPNTYFVRPVLDDIEEAPSAGHTLPANLPEQQYISIPLQIPPGGTSPDGSKYTYDANDASVGDLDGDGEYEIVLKWDPSNSRDNASAGYSGNAILDAYKLDGSRMWRIDLGRNIRAGAHYTQFMVHDLDGDGKAEIAMKTADGTVDGVGNVIGDRDADWVSRSPATLGKILAGPEYFTIFAGPNGAALVTTEYVPPRGDLGGWGGVGGNCGNDSTGNRVDRFLAAVAYLDGETPSVVMARGYYGRSVLVAWDWRDGHLGQRWVFDSASPELWGYSGQGNHNLSVADVDGDGHDEIIYGSMVVDHDGQGLFSTGFRHGDALHVGRFDPSHADLLVYGIHENEVTRCGAGPGTALYNARTGEAIWQTDLAKDVGRGLAADIDPRYPGAEFWGGSGGLLDVKGEPIGAAPRSTNFAVWWDADPLREILDSNWIAKWDWTTGSLKRLLTAEGCSSNNGTKSTPVLSADILGDWREEVIWRTSDNRFLRIYTTTVPAWNRMYTLMHDPQYRLAIAWQNVGYNQPPHPSFFLGEGMSAPPRPEIRNKQPGRGAAR
jgi:rhamnogalacturonan endolyase